MKASAPDCFYQCYSLLQQNIWREKYLDSFKLFQSLQARILKYHRDGKIINLYFSLFRIAPSTVNKLLVVKFFTNIDFFYFVGQHLTYCSGKIEVNEMIKNILKRCFFYSAVFQSYFLLRKPFLYFVCRWYVGTHESTIFIMRTHSDAINDFKMNKYFPPLCLLHPSCYFFVF